MSILKIAFILIVIHTGLLWSVETSPELSDNNNVASEAKAELILFFALAASCNSSYLFQFSVWVSFVISICLLLSPQFVYYSIIVIHGSVIFFFSLPSL